MDVALRVAEWVTMMHDGRVIVEGTPDEIRANETVHALYLGSRPSMSEPLLAVEDLNGWYGTAHVLQGVSFSMGAEPVALIGRNGMGKSTLCAGDRRAARVRAPAPCGSTARSCSASRRTRSQVPGSATCPRGGGCSSRSPSTSTWRSSAPLEGASGRPSASTSCSRGSPSART